MPDVVLAGLSVSGIMAGIWYCFLPANEVFANVVCLSGLGISFFFRDLLRQQISLIDRKTWMVSALVFLFLGFKSVVPNTFYDNGLYYIQTLKWVSKHAVVPGLANLHFRLGTISLWHILMAPFSTGFFTGFDDLGEFLFLWFFVGQFENILKNTDFESYWSFFVLLFTLVFATHFLGTGSPDLACGLLGMYCLSKLKNFVHFNSSDTPNNKGSNVWIYVLLPALFLPGIKLSALPYLMAVLICLIIFGIRKKIRLVFLVVLLSLMALLPILYRSWVLSGYLLFPVFQGFVKSDWLVPDSIVQEYLLLIKGFARHMLSIEEIRMGGDYFQIGKLTFSEWLPLWIRDRSLLDVFLLTSVFLGWLSMVWATHQKVKKSFLQHWPKILFTWLCSFLLLFWFVNAPDIRFAIGVFGFLFACFFGLLFVWIRDKVGFSVVQYAFPALILFSCLCIFLFRNRAVSEHYLLVPGFSQTGQYHSAKEPDGRMIFFTRNPSAMPGEISDQCWDAPLPCAPKLTEGLRFRGPRLQDGFRIEK